MSIGLDKSEIEKARFVANYQSLPEMQRLLLAARINLVLGEYYLKAGELLKAIFHYGTAISRFISWLFYVG